MLKNDTLFGGVDEGPWLTYYKSLYNVWCFLKNKSINKWVRRYSKQRSHNKQKLMKHYEKQENFLWNLWRTVATIWFTILKKQLTNKTVNASADPSTASSWPLT